MKHNLETEGIEFLAEYNPEILAAICQDNFLPPTQLILALQELEACQDKEMLERYLAPLLEHMSEAVSDQTAITLGLEEKDYE